MANLQPILHCFWVIVEYQYWSYHRFWDGVAVRGEPLDSRLRSLVSTNYSTDSTFCRTLWNVFQYLESFKRGSSV